MAEINISKLDRAEFILDTALARFKEINNIIGPAGSLPMLLSDTDYTDEATNISILFADVNNEMLELKNELKKENNHD